MATPTRGELQTQLQNLCHLFEEIREFAESDATNFLGLENTIVQATESDYAAEILSGLGEVRSSLNSALIGGDRAWVAHILDWGRFLDLGSTDPRAIIDEMFQDFIDNSIRLESRNFTFATPTPNGSNAGNGSIKRLTMDDAGFLMENAHVEGKDAECIQDANSGADRGREVFRFRGTDRSRDALEQLGSGAEAEISASHSDESNLLNPSFDAAGGTDVAPSSLTSWSSSITVQSSNFTLLTSSAAVTNVFLPPPTPTQVVRSLQVRATASLGQRLDLRRTSLNRNRPYYCRVAYNRSLGSGQGTLTLVMGRQSSSVAVSAQTGWNTLEVPGSPGGFSWFRNFNTESPSIQVKWTRTAGTITLDDVTFVPFTFFDGTGYVVAPGPTPFLSRQNALRRGDSFTWTDSATESVIQKWFWRKFNRYLPHSTGATIADP